MSRSIPNSLALTFDPSRNGLNLLRLLLALGVIVHHSFLVLGVPITGPFAKIMQEGFVDGFFAISGYLIVASWMRRPHWWQFLRARLLRILPAFWVCLAVTAFVLAPVGVWMLGAGFPPGFWSDAALFVVKNLALYGNSYEIGTTLAGLPVSDWNGSLWTLWWEFSCYLGVLFLGVTGLLRRRFILPALFVISLGVVVLTDLHLLGNYLFFLASRFGVMFTAGALVYQFAGRIPRRVWLVAASAALIGLCAWLLPDYRLLAALPIAYALIAVASYITSPRLRLRNDISYGTYIYAFPVQQLLAIAGAGALGVPLFAVLSALATAPLAIASWFLVEKRALRLKLGTAHPQTVHETAVEPTPVIP